MKWVVARRNSWKYKKSNFVSIDRFARFRDNGIVIFSPAFSLYLWQWQNLSRRKLEEFLACLYI